MLFTLLYQVFSSLTGVQAYAQTPVVCMVQREVNSFESKNGMLNIARKYSNLLLLNFLFLFVSK